MLSQHPTVWNQRPAPVKSLKQHTYVSIARAARQGTRVTAAAITHDELNTAVEGVLQAAAAAEPSFARSPNKSVRFSLVHSQVRFPGFLL